MSTTNYNLQKEHILGNNNCLVKKKENVNKNCINWKTTYSKKDIYLLEIKLDK